MKETIKNQVYELRTKSNITQEALAEALKAPDNAAEGGSASARE